jgi:hypothetical protein
MGHDSKREVRTFHALRIKGFAAVEVVSELTALVWSIAYVMVR